MQNVCDDMDCEILLKCDLSAPVCMCGYRGTVRPSVSHLKELCSLLGVNLRWLYGTKAFFFLHPYLITVQSAHLHHY